MTSCWNCLRWIANFRQKRVVKRSAAVWTLPTTTPPVYLSLLSWAAMWRHREGPSSSFAPPLLREPLPSASIPRLLRLAAAGQKFSWFVAFERRHCHCLHRRRRRSHAVQVCACLRCFGVNGHRLSPLHRKCRHPSVVAFAGRALSRTGSSSLSQRCRCCFQQQGLTLRTIGPPGSKMHQFTRAGDKSRFGRDRFGSRGVRAGRRRGAPGVAWSQAG